MHTEHGCGGEMRSLHLSQCIKRTLSCNRFAMLGNVERRVQ